MTAPDGIDAARAREVLAAILGQPGGAETVLTQLGSVPGAAFVPAEPGKRFRRAVLSRLAMADRVFSPAEEVGTRLRVSHVVRGVALQTTDLGPVDAASALVDSLTELVTSGGPAVRDAADAALYGLAVSAGLRWDN